MGGGKFYSKNKLLPGFYYNTVSKAITNDTSATFGVIAFYREHNWGPSGIIDVKRDSDILTLLGYNLNDIDWIYNMFLGNNERNGASEVLVYNPAKTGAVKASVVVSGLTITAKYEGTRGNDIKVKIEKVEIATSTYEYTVKVYLDGAVVEKKVISALSNFSSDWITLAGTLDAVSATALSGGTNGTVETATKYADFLDALETYRFNVLVYDGNNATIKASIVTFMETYRDDLGRCCRAVMASYSADYERITSVNLTKLTLKDGTEYTAEQVCWWVGGMEAGAKGNQDLTNQAYPNAVAISPRLTQKEQEQAIAGGQLVFVEEYGEVKILEDINTLVTFTSSKGQTWRYNELIRTIDEIGNDWHKYFSTKYNGKVDGVDAESVAGAYCKEYLNNMVANHYIEQYDDSDLSITYEAETKSVTIDISIKKAFSPDKIYCTLYV